MFDPDAYLKLVRDAIERCPHVNLDEEDWSDIRYPHGRGAWQVVQFTWKGRFHSGERLHVAEYYTRRDRLRPTQILRNCSHQYMDASDQLIFRFSTHGNDIPYDDACCLHPRTDDISLYDGDAALKGFSLYNVDFLRTLGIVVGHLSGAGLPWE